MRCTAKGDCRTIDHVLIALGKELGEVQEVLAIEWSGKVTVRPFLHARLFELRLTLNTLNTQDLLTQLTLTLSRFISLRRLEISALADLEDDEDVDQAVNADNKCEHLQKSYSGQEAKRPTWAVRSFRKRVTLRSSGIERSF